MTRRRRRFDVAQRALGGWLAGSLLLVASACSDPDEAPLRILAASSLTDALTAVNRSFEGGRVEASYTGSQVARLQIEQGAPVDVFCSADERHMQALVDEGLVTDAGPFAAGELVLIVPASSPIETFADLREASRIVLADPEVPAGRYARELLARADGVLGEGFERRVLARVVSEESNVRLVRAKVELGEADAAIVYRSDAVGARAVRVVPVPEALAVRATYWVGRVVRAQGGASAGAEAWIAHLRSAAGSAALREHGLTPLDAVGER